MDRTSLPPDTLVSLKQDLEQFHLKKGDVGRITQVDQANQIYVVTFKNFQGESKAWIQLREEQIRPV